MKTNKVSRWSIFPLILIATITCEAQSLRELLKQAEANYPLLKAKAFEVQAGEQGVSAVKGSAIPSLDAAYQLNYATYNNITGMATSQYFVPISGPPSASNIYDGVFGSAASALLNWQPFTFGQRKSQIDLARANFDYVQADATYALFQHRLKVINLYLDVVTAQELIKVYAKNFDRAMENLRVVRTLSRTGLRPGVDTALFKAEQSKAKIEMLNQKRELETKEVQLAELLSVKEVSYSIDSTYVRKLPLFNLPDSAAIHPLVLLSVADLEINRNRRSVAQRTLYPKLSMWGTAYARGSGIRYDGNLNSQEGLSFSRYNYGIGLQLSVPLLRAIEVKPQINQQEAYIHAYEEKLNHITLQLQKQQQVAELMLQNALAIAEESPVLYESAEYSYRALSSRYSSGLVNFADLVLAQYGLLKAETDLKNSYMEVWKSLLYKAAVKGDLTIFLNQIQ